MQGGILPCLVRETLSCRDCRGRASPTKAIMSRATGPVAIHRRRSSPGRLDRQRHPAFSVATPHSGQMLLRFRLALLGKTLTGRQNPAGPLGLCLGHRARTTLMKCRPLLHGARGMRVTRAVMGRDDVPTRLGPATGTLRRFPRQRRRALVAVARAVWPKGGLDQTQVSLSGILRHLHRRNRKTKKDGASNLWNPSWPCPKKRPLPGAAGRARAVRRAQRTPERTPTKGGAVEIPRPL
mmetsp:Transcript_39722/g.105154  ORF Transcript_39722/g.105154 Transcript_39722/m.105154 type:complete len:238 (-) Transcript_39722:544-1257(-)